MSRTCTTSLLGELDRGRTGLLPLDVGQGLAGGLGNDVAATRLSYAGGGVNSRARGSKDSRGKPTILPEGDWNEKFPD